MRPRVQIPGPRPALAQLWPALDRAPRLDASGRFRALRSDLKIVFAVGQNLYLFLDSHWTVWERLLSIACRRRKPADWDGCPVVRLLATEYL